MSNVDELSVKFRDRLIALETERRERAEDIREIAKEMKDHELSKVQVAAIKLAVKRYFEDADKKEFRISVEEVALSLGEYANTPLGAAAMERHKA